MDAGTLSLGKVFGQDRRHLDPLFQHPYVWNDVDRWEPLWDDVRSVGVRLAVVQETWPHFMGAIVRDQMRKPAGQVEARPVIDGQQRLTTIYDVRPKKGEGILKHSILQLNLRLEDVDAWDEERTRARGAGLLEHAIVIWCRPDDAASRVR